MPFHGSSLIFNIESSHLRIGLRVYFTALFLLLAFVGDKCCNSRVKVFLMKKFPVNLPLTSGWLGGISAFKTWIDQRRLPGGWLGAIMIIAEVIAIASDLLVSGTVQTIQVPGRCFFGTGVVLPVNPITWRSILTIQQKAYEIVSQAQLTSQENGGLRGIYRKINAAPNFRADPQDVLGYWNCVDIQHDITYDTSKVSYLDNYYDLIDRGYLYGNSSTDGYVFQDGSYSSLVFWGASVADDEREPWDVKASIDVTNSTFTIPDGLQTMRSYHCTMNASSVEWMLSQIRTKSTFDKWAPGLYELVGGVNGPRPSNITSILESILEDMVMVGYGDEVTTTSAPEGDLTQGCLLPRAEIPWPVFTLLVLATIGVFLMIIYWIVLWLELRSIETKLQPSYANEVKENTPGGLVGWMAQAVREHDIGQEVRPRPRDIAHWNLGQVEGRLKVCSSDAPARSGRAYSETLCRIHSQEKRSLGRKALSPQPALPHSHR